MSEQDTFRGKLAGAQDRAWKLGLKLDGLRGSLRTLLDPIDAVETLDGEQVAQQAVEFAAVQTEYREARAMIDKIKGILGR